MADVIRELNCLWTDCNQVISCFDKRSLSVHLANHLPHINIVEADEDDQLYACGWKECRFRCKESNEVILHVKYHAYHARLKQLGTYYIKKKNLPSCMFPKPIHEQIPPLSESYICKWSSCDECFTCYETYLLHVKTHVWSEDNNKEKRYTCCWGDCQSETNKKVRLEVHLRMHTGEKVVACPVCGHMFSGVTKFGNHCSRQIPIEQQTFKCSHCNNCYPTAKLLREHISMHVHHYKCPYCDLTCRAPAILAKHIRYRHLSDKPFQCSLCTYKSKTAYDLKVHRQTHTDEVFSCQQCDSTFTKEHNLAKHVEQVHENQEKQIYKCHLCEDRCFTRGYGLTLHLSRVHNVEKPNGYSRFIYNRAEDGYWKLQTTRLETVIVTEEDEEQVDNPASHTSIEIQVVDDDADDMSDVIREIS